MAFKKYGAYSCGKSGTKLSPWSPAAEEMWPVRVNGVEPLCLQHSQLELLLQACTVHATGCLDEVLFRSLFLKPIFDTDGL